MSNSNIVTAEEIRQMQRSLAVIQDRIDEMQVNADRTAANWGEVNDFVQDLARWMDAHTDDPTTDNQRVLERAAAALMTALMFPNSGSSLVAVWSELREN